MCNSECERVALCRLQAEVADHVQDRSNSSRSSTRGPAMRPLLSLLCLALFLCLMLEAETANVVVKRRPLTQEEEAAIKKARECNFYNPCGWAVYIPKSRNLDYYIRNLCHCPAGKENCSKMEDDLSVNAYVYRCTEGDSPPINKDKIDKLASEQTGTGGIGQPSSTAM